MGAETFTTPSRGHKTAKKAFHDAVEQAQYDHGHAGYSGTIAEKHYYVMIDVPKEWKGRPYDYADHLLDEGDDRIENKWGPAGCIKVSDDEWLFFGWASS